MIKKLTKILDFKYKNYINDKCIEFLSKYC